MKRVIGVVSLILALVVPYVGLAQDEDQPTATPGAAQSQIVMLGASHKVYFPSSIWVQAGVTFSPENDVKRIEQLTFTYELPDGRLVDVPVDPSLHVIEAAWGLNAIYRFSFDAADRPPPMATIPYTWTLVLDDGATGTFEHEFVFADERFEWQAFTEEWTMLYTYSPAMSASMLLRDMRQVDARLRSDTRRTSFYTFVIYEPGDDFCPDDQHATPTPIPAFNPLIATLEAASTALAEAAVYRTPTPAVDLTAATEAASTLEITPAPTVPPATVTPLPPCDSEAAAQVYADAGMIALRQYTANLLYLKNDMADAMARRAWQAVWEDPSGETSAEEAARGPIPAWFVEGLVRLYEPMAHAGAFAVTGSAVLAGDAFALEAMQPKPAESAGPGNLLMIDPWNAQSITMVLYLVEQYGSDAPARVGRAIPDHATFDEALLAEIGEDEATLYQNWFAWVASAGDAISGWTPYQLPTPTPTLTRTPTVTFTPSLTWTPSQTPFPTVFGVPVQTKALPFRSPTPTRRPPTNTPRPPVTATPRGELSIPDIGGALSTAGDASVLVGVGTLLAALVAVIVIGVAVARRR
ncbi:MAG: hypothetical protein JXB47_17395 [Anaerolineae bacterium]|nr:hypothetical protein [Anaerolineae bacterium]